MNKQNRINWERGKGHGPHGEEEDYILATTANYTARIVCGDIDDDGIHLVVAALVDDEGEVLFNEHYEHRGVDLVEQRITKLKRSLGAKLRKLQAEEDERNEELDRIARDYAQPLEGWKVRDHEEIDENGHTNREGYHREFTCGAHARIYKAAAGNWVGCWHRGDWFNSRMKAYDKGETLEEVADAVTACILLDAEDLAKAREERAQLIAELKHVKLESRRGRKNLKKLIEKLEQEPIDSTQELSL